MIKYYNRNTKKYDIEKVAGEKYLNWTYSSPVGMGLLETVVKKKAFSKLYGRHCDSKRSRNKVGAFIKEFDIDMSKCQDSPDSFTCFNDFFVRKLTPDARPVNMNPDVLVSPGDGKLLVYDNIDLNNLVQVKGYTYSLYELIQDEKTADKFQGGVCMILRLCPTDYHRFHFFDSGVCGKTKEIKGHYYSVNPIALQKVQKLFCQNKREWSLFHSDNFGDALYVEVGATCVGSIIQTYSSDTKVSRGDEKGYFKFGGSTVVLFFEKDKISIDNDILEQSFLGYETAVLFGESIGLKYSSKMKS